MRAGRHFAKREPRQEQQPQGFTKKRRRAGADAGAGTGAGTGADANAGVGAGTGADAGTDANADAPGGGFLAKLRKSKEPVDAQEAGRARPQYQASAIPERPLVFTEPGLHRRIALCNEFLDSLSAEMRALVVVGRPPAHEWWDPTEAGREVVHPVFETSKEPAPRAHLTAAEQARKRRNERQLAQAQARERIKEGIDPVPAPKLKQSNVMAVMGSKYLQDPTKYDLAAREAEAQRREAHLAANEARHEASMATKHGRENERILERRRQGIHTVVARVELDGKKRFVLDYTAKKFLMTGALLLAEGSTEPSAEPSAEPALVIVEGGEKEVRKYEKVVGRIGGQLVWKGELRRALFGKWSVHEMDMAERRAFLARFGCDGYA